MLGYGIGVILLNIGMYFVAPAVMIDICIRKIQQKPELSISIKIGFRRYIQI